MKTKERTESMKPTTILGVLAITIALTCQVQAQAFLTNGLVAYYPFNGNANDASGNGHNGIMNGTTILPATNQIGLANSALHFGGGSYISVTPTPFDVNAPWTISFFCRVDANAGPENFVSTGVDNESGINMRYYYGGAYRWAIASAGFGTAAACNATNDATRWTMFTCARSGDLVEMFLNDVRVISTNVAATSLDAGAFLIGKHYSVAYELVGSLSDMRIYNRALSAWEVQQLYEYETQPQTCSPHAATATAQLVNGFVVDATITDPGCGYTNAPAVLIVGGGGSGATATAVVSNGVVVKIHFTDAGAGYTSAPKIVIGSPPFMPWLETGVSRIKVTQHVVLGRCYVLESSLDLTNWTQVGDKFTAQAEIVTQEFEVDVTGRFFRIRQVVP